MSRTYRRDRIDLDRNDKPLPYNVSWWDLDYEYGELGKSDYYSKRNKKWDSKPWHKCPGWYKRMNERISRAKVRNAMANGRYDNIPRFKKTYMRDWT